MGEGRRRYWAAPRTENIFRATSEHTATTRSRLRLWAMLRAGNLQSGSVGTLVESKPKSKARSWFSTEPGKNHSDERAGETSTEHRYTYRERPRPQASAGRCQSGVPCG